MSVRSCSWCHEFNEISAESTTCWRCGHRADLARIHCDCQQCQELYLATRPFFPGGDRGL